MTSPRRETDGAQGQNRTADTRIFSPKVIPPPDEEPDGIQSGANDAGGRDWNCAAGVPDRLKSCSVCKADKPLADFNRHRRTRDGYQPECRACSRAGKVAWRQANADRVKAYEDGRRESVKQQARRTSRQAEAAGLLVRPDRCEACSAIGPVHGHHSDYSKPLDIDWLCRLCHEKEHAETRVGKRTITVIGATLLLLVGCSPLPDLHRSDLAELPCDVDAAPVDAQPFDAIETLPDAQLSTDASQLPGAILLLGQSNAVGRGDCSPVGLCPSWPTAYRERVNLGAVREGLLSPRPGGGMGVELALGRCTARPIIKFAIDGSPISAWPGYLPEVVNLVGGDPVGLVVWLQGERDSRTVELGAAYQLKLRAWLDQLEETFHAPTLVVRLHSNLNAQYLGDDLVRAAQDAEAAHLLVPDAFGLQGDQVHYSSFGLRDMGLAICAEVSP